jgi:phosphate starvation-inducible PhoH-like protein
MKRRTKKQTTPKVKHLEARTDNQKEYIRAIVENDVIFCSGPSGSGKSYIAAGMASSYLHKEDIDKIVITRPLICTGKDIGSLPGDVMEKITPYLMPMQEHLKYFLSQSYYGHYFNNGQICYHPLEIMRGSTFNNAFMILDEAQNCTLEQIKMFITRMGENSKVIINGDIDQTDLRNKSGLSVCIERLKNIKNVDTINFTYGDIQRNSIIGKILTALEDVD